MATSTFSEVLRLSSARVFKNTTVLGGGDVTEWISIPDYADKSVHVFGTFNGQTVTIQGSNEPSAPTDPESLHMVDGTTAVTFTTAGIKQILENTTWIRASVSGTTGVSLTVIITASTGRR